MHWTYHSMVLDLTQVLSVQHLSQVGGSVTVDTCAASDLASARTPVTSPEQNMFKVRLHPQKIGAAANSLQHSAVLYKTVRSCKIHVLPSRCRCSGTEILEASRWEITAGDVGIHHSTSLKTALVVANSTRLTSTTVVVSDSEGAAGVWLSNEAFIRSLAG